ncbi:hypothetical protein ACLOJK_029496 [Asimina triloba]
MAGRNRLPAIVHGWNFFNGCDQQVLTCWIDERPLLPQHRVSLKHNSIGCRLLLGLSHCVGWKEGLPGSGIALPTGRGADADRRAAGVRSARRVSVVMVRCWGRCGPAWDGAGHGFYLMTERGPSLIAVRSGCWSLCLDGWPLVCCPLNGQMLPLLDLPWFGLLPLTGLRRMPVTRCPDGLKETSCYDLLADRIWHGRFAGFQIQSWVACVHRICWVLLVPSILRCGRPEVEKIRGKMLDVARMLSSLGKMEHRIAVL